MYARSNSVNGVLDIDEVCDVELTRGFRQSRGQFDLITTLSMDHEHFRACIMIDPKTAFMGTLLPVIAYGVPCCVGISITTLLARQLFAAAVLVVASTPTI